MPLRELLAGKSLKVKQSFEKFPDKQNGARTGSGSANRRRAVGMKTRPIVRNRSRSARLGAGPRSTC